MNNEVDRLKKMRLFGIIWMVVFFGPPMVSWLCVVGVYLLTNNWPFIQGNIGLGISLYCAAGLYGYFKWHNAEVALLGKE